MSCIIIQICQKESLINVYNDVSDDCAVINAAERRQV